MCAWSEASKHQERYSGFCYLQDDIHYAAVIPYSYRLNHTVETNSFLSKSMSKTLCVITGTAFLKRKLNLILFELCGDFWQQFHFLVPIGLSKTFFRYHHLNMNINLKCRIEELCLFAMAIFFKTYMYTFIWVCASPEYYLSKAVINALLLSEALRTHTCIDSINLIPRCRLYFMLLLNDLILTSTMGICLK